jgi:1,4-alpha-glucan branching enzyme
MIYEFTERFIMSLSHDEVVHGKGSLLEKMPGDLWQKFANLRLLLAYQYTRPGKKLIFMGTEIAPFTEWNHDASLDWHLANDEPRKGLAQFLGALGRVYREYPCLWEMDADPRGTEWIDHADHENSVLSYLRRDETRHLVVVLNLTPTPRGNYRIGVPEAGCYREILSSDDSLYYGSEFETLRFVGTEPIPFHGHAQSLRLQLPPLGALILEPVG